jgi:hypothetical protein
MNRGKVDHTYHYNSAYNFLIETVLYLVLEIDKHEPAAIRQRSTRSMCHDGEAS